MIFCIKISENRLPPYKILVQVIDIRKVFRVALSVTSGSGGVTTFGNVILADVVDLSVTSGSGGVTT